jgi:hypothetical protein
VTTALAEAVAMSYLGGNLLIQYIPSLRCRIFTVPVSSLSR